MLEPLKKAEEKSPEVSEKASRRRFSNVDAKGQTKPFLSDFARLTRRKLQLTG